MMSRPPHVLLTTPESLALMLAMESYRSKLTHVETVIVDEVHALAGNKRGAHLALLLESLAEITRVPLRRVGLSATVAPLERVAAYLAGTDRDCAVVDCRGLREMKLDVVAPFAGAMAPLAQCARTAYALTQHVRGETNGSSYVGPRGVKCGTLAIDAAVDLQFFELIVQLLACVARGTAHQHLSGEHGRLILAKQ